MKNHKASSLSYQNLIRIIGIWVYLFAYNGYGQSGNIISLEKIQQHYAGKWPANMSFVKKVNISRYGRQDSTIHYHAYSFPRYARVDRGNLNDGNATISHGDITFYFKNYKKDGSGPTRQYYSDYMLGPIYYDDIAGMKKVLAYSKIDFTMQGKGIWEGRPVYVIGATSLDDRYHTQVWYDVEYLYPVRFIDGRSGNVLDTQYRIKKRGTAWLAESAKEYVNKKQTGIVSYLLFSFDRHLPEQLFDPARFGHIHWLGK